MKNWKIGIIIFSVFLAGFFIFPTYKDGQESKQKNEILQKELSIKIKELKALNTKQTTFTTTETTLFRKIPRDEMQESIIRDVDLILNRYGFELEGGVSFSRGFNADVDAPEIKTNFVIIGPKNNLVPLISAFENNERFYGIEKLSVQIFTEDDKQMVSLPVSLSSFFQEK